MAKATFESKENIKFNGILDIDEFTITGEEEEVVNIIEKIKHLNGCDISLAINFKKE